MSRLAELVVLGFSLGALYALMGVSVTLVYQASRVANVAFVGIGAAAAILHWDLVTAQGRFGGGMGWWPAMFVAVLLASVLGLATEFLVRPLAGRTVASFLLLAGWTVTLLGGVNAIWGAEPKLLPRAWSGPTLAVGDVAVQRQALAALGIAALAAAGLALMARHTRLGLALRASAEDPEGAAAMGIEPKRLSQAAWVLGSALAAVAVTLAVHPVLSNPYSTTVYLPFAFGAGLLGGFRSFRLAVIGGLALGLVPTLLDPSDSLVRIGGVPNLVAFSMIAVLVVRRPHLVEPDRTGDAGGVGTSCLSVSMPTWVRRAAAGLLAAVLGVAVPAFSDTTALWAWTNGLSVFLICASIVMVMGWSGDIALGQVAFAGVGAYMVANLAVRLDLPHVLAIPLAALAAVVPALVVGLVTRRTRGRLPSAVISVGLIVVASSLLWGPRSRWFTGDGDPLARPDWMDVLFGRPAVSFYLFCLAVTVAVVWFALNLRSSRVGRALAAGRESVAAARAAGIDPSHYRLVVLVFAAMVAAAGGIIQAYLGGPIDPSRFAAFLAVQYLLYAVVGGAGSLAGTAAVVFAFEVAPALGDGTVGAGPGRLITLGVLAVAATRFLPQGLAGVAHLVSRSVSGPPTPILVGAAAAAAPAGATEPHITLSAGDFDAGDFDPAAFDQLDFGDIDFDALDFGPGGRESGEAGPQGSGREPDGDG